MTPPPKQKVFAITSMATAVLSGLRGLLLAVGALIGAKTLHNRLLEHTMRVSPSFFDAQRAGRMLNRFAHDTEQMDVVLPDILLNALTCWFQVRHWGRG